MLCFDARLKLLWQTSLQVGLFLFSHGSGRAGPPVPVHWCAAAVVGPLRAVWMILVLVPQCDLHHAVTALSGEDSRAGCNCSAHPMPPHAGAGAGAGWAVPVLVAARFVLPKI